MANIPIDKQSDIFQLVYTSLATDRFVAKDLNQIETTSTNNNRRLRITGILVFGNGRFMQFLEGSKSNVMDLLSIIRKDSRHKDLDILQDGFIPVRQFANWSMRITFPSEIYPHSGSIYRKLFDFNKPDQKIIDQAIESRSLLLGFKEECYRAHP